MNTPYNNNPLREASPLYMHLYNECIYDVDDPNDPTATRTVERHEAFIASLLKIETFVANVLATNEPAFKLVATHVGRPTLRRQRLAEYFAKVYSLSLLDTTGYELSEHVQLFFDCWVAAGMTQEDLVSPRGYSLKLGQESYEVFNDFLALIRSQSKTPAFIKRVSRRKEKSSRNFKSGCDYVDALFEFRSSRLLVLRIDFGYRKEFAQQVTAKEAKNDLAHFLRNRRGNRELFGGWVGHIWKLEWSPVKGCHFHLILFFRGSERWRDVFIAQQLGIYWEKLTDGRGVYWNCNAAKGRYKRLGIGMLEYHDVEKIAILKKDVLGYLVKTDQCLKATTLGDGDCFGRGEMPDSGTYKIRRPRAERFIYR